MDKVFQDFIQNIYKTRKVSGPSGIETDLHSEIDPQEGQFLYNIINNDPTVLKTLEVGCAYGLASLHICAALKGRQGALHTIVDPNQTGWGSVGVNNLKRCGVDYFKLVEEKSEFALPRLLENHEGTYDFIFVDGWHTFDHTLLDCFYATRMLRVGGYLAVDDVWNFPGIKRVVGFVGSYPCYQRVGTVNETNGDVRMIGFKKIANDERRWDWHDETFASNDPLKQKDNLKAFRIVESAGK